MAAKNKNVDVEKVNVAEETTISEPVEAKKQYRIILVSPSFIVIDKNGNKVMVRLTKEEILKCKIGNLYEI